MTESSKAGTEAALLYEKQGGVVTLTLNRPAARNALTAAMLLDMERILFEIEADDEARVVVLTGAGQAFSSGADLESRFPRGAPRDGTGVLPPASSSRRKSPLFRSREGAVDEAFGQVDAAPFVEILRQGMQDPFQRAISAPVLEAAVARLVGPIPLRKLLPRGSRSQHPEDAAQHLARLTPRSPPPVLAPPGLRDQRLDERPLGIGQVHANSGRSASRKRIRIASSAGLRQLARS